MSAEHLLGWCLAALSGVYFGWESHRTFLRRREDVRWLWFLGSDLVMAFSLALLLGWAAMEGFRRIATPFSLETVQNGYLEQAVFDAIILSYLVCRKVPLRAFFQSERLPIWKTVGFAVLFSLAYMPFVQGVANLFNHSGSDDQEVVQFFLTHPALHDRLWVVVLAVVIAPFSEELLFRGFLYRIFQTHFGKLAAAFFTSVLFATIHLSLPAMLPLGLLALALTVALEKTGSLLVPMLMHAIFNGVSLYFLWNAPAP